ncbi:MAG: RluA family pseudouridine synthase [Bdellovibrionales bacterium]|nr:RluA family pseudouridine synthase [Bdellovibrionales bacterium]
MPTKRQHLSYTRSETSRVDAFLVEYFPGISRSYIHRLFLDKKVQVNDRTVRKGHILRPGDLVSIEPFVLPSERRLQPNFTLTLDVVYQTRHYLLINKPSGIPTHPNDFEDTNTISNILIASFPNAATVFDDPLRPGIVHRLDTNTSGLMILALTLEAFHYFRSLFNARLVRKTYTALVIGKISEPGEINFPIAHHHKNHRKMVALTNKAGGISYRSKPREAKTLFSPLKIGSSCTLLEVRTLTGRMHQVRIHLSSIGHPLCGDRLYQSVKHFQQDISGLKHRHFLHASSLSFPDFESKEEVTYKVGLPLDLQETMNRCFSL